MHGQRLFLQGGYVAQLFAVCSSCSFRDGRLSARGSPLSWKSIHTGLSRTLHCSEWVWVVAGEFLTDARRRVVVGRQRIFAAHRQPTQPPLLVRACEAPPRHAVCAHCRQGGQRSAPTRGAVGPIRATLTITGPRSRRATAADPPAAPEHTPLGHPPRLIRRIRIRVRQPPPQAVDGWG